MNKITIRECPICTGRRAELLHSQRFAASAESTIGDGYDVVACESCGMVFADTNSTQQVYDAFYQNAFRGGV